MSISTPFTFASTGDDVIKGVGLAGKRAIVTGGSSGIGVETARVLASAGAEITLAVRRIDDGKKIATQISEATHNPNIHAKSLDLADQNSVATFVAAWQGPLHILINNAGIMALPNLERTQEGWELQFATNYLGHFALTVGLHKALAAANGARIVSLSSSGSLFCPVLFDDLQFEFVPYSPLLAYGQSKTAQSLLAVEATRRWSQDGIFANSVNPGAIATNLQRHTGGLKTPPERQKTVAQGASTSVLLAASPFIAGIGGRYFEDCNEAAIVTSRPADFRGVARYALDTANAERLWDVASNLISGARRPNESS